MDDLFEKMKKLIADRLEIAEAKITLDSSFRQDLGADSLDTYELVYAPRFRRLLEARFGRVPREWVLSL